VALVVGWGGGEQVRLRRPRWLLVARGARRAFAALFLAPSSPLATNVTLRI
jgi:hypothetical protein